jgi:hypothetical protein
LRGPAAASDIPDIDVHLFIFRYPPTWRNG